MRNIKQVLIVHRLFTEKTSWLIFENEKLNDMEIAV